MEWSRFCQANDASKCFLALVPIRRCRSPGSASRYSSHCAQTLAADSDFLTEELFSGRVAA